MTTRYINWQHCTSNDNTVHPLIALYIQWQHGTSTDSTVHPMTTRYIRWQHCTSDDNTVHPLTTLYFQWQHGTSTNSTVLPMTTRYIHWQHCTSNGNTVHPLTALYFQWKHGTSTDSTVLPNTRRYTHWQYSTALTARDMQSMSIPCIVVFMFCRLRDQRKLDIYLKYLTLDGFLCDGWLRNSHNSFATFSSKSVRVSVRLRGYVECAVTKRKAVINLFVCSSV